MFPKLLIKALCSSCGHEFNLPAVITTLNNVEISSVNAANIFDAHLKDSHPELRAPSQPTGA